MKIRRPVDLDQEIRQAAHDILNDRQTIIDAAEAIAGKIAATNKPLTLLIVTQRVLSWIKQEMHKLVRGATKIVDEERETGQAAFMPLPFPWLPVYLEIAPGTQRHQRAMTGPDMDKAKAIWQNRRDQAEISYQGFERAYELVRPLLAEDDRLTVADVADQLGLDFDEGDETGEPDQ